MITAAHCTVETMLNQTRVLLHRHDTTKSTGEEDGLEYTVREAVTHPLFSDEPDYLNDISIWMLEPVDEAKFQAFDFSGTKVLLDDDNDEKKRGHEGNLMRSAGWGTTVETGETSKVLLYVGKFLWIPRDISETNRCAAERSTCQLSRKNSASRSTPRWNPTITERIST